MAPVSLLSFLSRIFPTSLKCIKQFELSSTDCLLFSCFLPSAFGTKEACFKAIGYRHENEKLETTEHYLERLGSLMKIYGAVVQTNPQGVQNMHGLEEGWAWLARLLNDLPANVYTAVVLEAFLRMAGYALHSRYRSHFIKIIAAIFQHFLQALDRSGPKINAVIARRQDYIEFNAFLKEPEG